MPETVYPLAGVEKTMNMSETDDGDIRVTGGHGSGMYQYYLKVRIVLLPVLLRVLLLVDAVGWCLVCL